MTSTVSAPLSAEQRATIRRIAAFRQRFGDGHFYLACHAALPLALTPDLLYCLWVNFQQDSHQEFLDIPWIAVSDLIISNLCEEVGCELYEMDMSMRNELLKQLQHDPRFGPKRIRELADFMLTYVKQQLNSPDLDARDLAEAQKWRALAYKKPNEAAHEIALTLAQLSLEDKMEWIRRAALLETLVEPLFEYNSLLNYAAAMVDYARGKEAEASAKFRQILGATDQLQITGVTLTVPASMVLSSPIPERQRELIRLSLLNFLQQHRLWLMGGAVVTALSVAGVTFYWNQIRQSATSDIARLPTPSGSISLATPSVKPTSLQPSTTASLSPSPLNSAFPPQPSLLTRAPIQSTPLSAPRLSTQSQLNASAERVTGTRTVTTQNRVSSSQLRTSGGSTTDANSQVTTSAPTPTAATPTTANDLFQLGNTLSNQNKLDEAVDAYRKAINLEPQNTSAYHNLGNVLIAQNKLDEAITAYRKAIAINPNSDTDYNGLGNALIAQNKPDEAIAAYRKAIDLAPKSGMYYDSLGIALKTQNKLDEAITTYRKAISINPKDAFAYYSLGTILIDQNKRNEATMSLQIAANLYQEQGRMEEYQITLNQLKRILQ